MLLLAGAYAGVSAQSRLRDADTRLLDECRTVFTQGDYGALTFTLALKLTELSEHAVMQLVRRPAQRPNAKTFVMLFIFDSPFRFVLYH